MSSFDGARLIIRPVSLPTSSCVLQTSEERHRRDAEKQRREAAMRERLLRVKRKVLGDAAVLADPDEPPAAAEPLEPEPKPSPLAENPAAEKREALPITRDWDRGKLGSRAPPSASSSALPAQAFSRAGECAERQPARSARRELPYDRPELAPRRPHEDETELRAELRERERLERERSDRDPEFAPPTTYFETGTSTKRFKTH